MLDSKAPEYEPAPHTPVTASVMTPRKCFWDSTSRQKLGLSPRASQRVSSPFTLAQVELGGGEE